MRVCNAVARKGGRGQSSDDSIKLVMIQSSHRFGLSASSPNLSEASLAGWAAVLGVAALTLGPFGLGEPQPPRPSPPLWPWHWCARKKILLSVRAYVYVFKNNSQNVVLFCNSKNSGTKALFHISFWTVSVGHVLAVCTYRYKIQNSER